MHYARIVIWRSRRRWCSGWVARVAAYASTSRCVERRRARIELELTKWMCPDAIETFGLGSSVVVFAALLVGSGGVREDLNFADHANRAPHELTVATGAGPVALSIQYPMDSSWRWARPSAARYARTRSKRAYFRASGPRCALSRAAMRNAATAQTCS